MLVAGSHANFKVFRVLSLLVQCVPTEHIHVDVLSAVSLMQLFLGSTSLVPRSHHRNIPTWPGIHFSRIHENLRNRFSKCINGLSHLSRSTIGVLIIRPSNSASKLSKPMISNYASLSGDSFPIIAPATMVFVAC